MKEAILAEQKRTLIIADETLPVNNKKENKIVLFIPNTRWFNKRVWTILPHAALILTTLLKDEFDFDVLDANVRDLSEEDCAMYLREAQPKAVLVSALSVEYHMQYHRALDLAKEIDSGVVTILGGVYPTVLEEEALKDPKIDYIFIGHAEKRLQEFLRLAIARDKKRIRSLQGIGFRDEQGKAVINPAESYIPNVKNLTKLDYSLIDVDAYRLPSQSNRVAHVFFMRLYEGP